MNNGWRWIYIYIDFIMTIVTYSMKDGWGVPNPLALRHKRTISESLYCT